MPKSIETPDQTPIKIQEEKEVLLGEGGQRQVAGALEGCVLVEGHRLGTWKAKVAGVLLESGKEAGDRVSVIGVGTDAASGSVMGD